MKKKVREYVRDNGLGCASDVHAALEAKIEQILIEANMRARSNGRTTMMGRDL